MMGMTTMSDKQRYELGPDVDLDEEIVLDSKGDRITEAVAEEMAEYAIGEARGRPSLSQSGISPEVKARVPAELQARLLERAKAEHRKPSVLVREALEQYLEAS